MKIRLLVSFPLCILAAGAACGAIPENLRALTESMPSSEVAILLDVGREYGLGGDALKLLLVIRKIENGSAGIEMGVASDFPRHPARRHAGDFGKSLHVQAQWAAGTIRKHYTGDLKTFAKQYCPPMWTHWLDMASNWMNKE